MHNDPSYHKINHMLKNSKLYIIDQFDNTY